MAMVACRECGASVSGDAAMCPRCGKQRPGRATTPGRVLVILLIAFAFMWAVALVTGLAR